jgi:hypothetical protein
MTLLEAALTSPLCVLSVIGDHAGESVCAIFKRKIADIERKGLTFWFIRSPKTLPVRVQEICRHSRTYTLFVEPATKGGTRPTVVEDVAREYSKDGVLWHRLPKDLSPVTGKLNKCATALVFDMMTTINGTLDLWDYGDFSDIHKPIRFMLGSSTVCAVRNETKLHPEKMKSRYRGIVAVARLANPYCVWLR